MAGYIPKEQLEAYRRWQADSFDPPRPKAVEPPPPPLPEPEPEVSEVVANFGLPTAEDIERIHNEAHQSGYEAGYQEGQQEGYRAGLEAAQAEVQRLGTLADNFATALTAMDQTVADQVLALAVEVARQVMRGTVAVRPEALLPIIREAIAALPLHHGHVILHVNPADAEVVKAQLGENFAQSGWRILEDSQIEAGGCYVQAGASEVDATLETRWQRVLEAIGAGPGTWLDQP